VQRILEKARAQVVRTVNTEMVRAYWLIGREIVEEEQQGRARAGNGEALLAQLSAELQTRFDKRYTRSNLQYMRQFYLTFPRLLGVDLDSPPPGDAARPAQPQPLLDPLSPLDEGRIRARPVVLRGGGGQEPLVLEFVGLPESPRLVESDIGQMQLDVNYYDETQLSPGDNPTIGLLLSGNKNDLMVKYTLGKGNRQIFASRYKLHPPSEKELAAEIQRELSFLHEDAD
jgi:hypothetical protein